MNDQMKKAVGCKAVALVQSGMTIGLGTGSTVFYFIEQLGQAVQQGLIVQAIASSVASEHQAKKRGIPLADSSSVAEVDLTIDGADEITQKKEIIKGGGGALLREKVLASMSHEMVVIVDEEKVVDKLGNHPLAVEILPYARRATTRALEQLGYRGALRADPTGLPFTSDNGNMIYDIHFDSVRQAPGEDHKKMIQIPGVLETGLFLNMAGRVLVGRRDGTVDCWP